MLRIHCLASSCHSSGSVLKRTAVGCGPVRLLASSAASVFWSSQVVFGNEQLEKGTVVVDDDGIISQCHVGQSLQAARDLAATLKAEFHHLCAPPFPQSVLSPGAVDVHTHVSALGRDWEGYETATKAAAAGGITAIVNMPLNSLPPITTVATANLEVMAARQLYADVGLWGGIVPENIDTDLKTLVEHKHILGLKAFLSPLPPAAGFTAVSTEELKAGAFTVAQSSQPQKPILVHCELMTEQEWTDQTEQSYNLQGRTAHQAHVLSRPKLWEERAVRAVIDIAAETGTHMHIVHLSNADCLPLIEMAKTQGLKITVETCPHYLSSELDDLVAMSDPRIKCFPPIRDRANRDRLWQDGLETGLIDMIASDHSPCEPVMRRNSEFRHVWGGLSGLQYQITATWTEVEKRGYSVVDMADWWNEGPTKLLKSVRKGSISVGNHADLCWWDPSFEGIPNDYSREYHRWSGDCVYTEIPLKGRVLGTWCRGKRAYDGIDDIHVHANGRIMEC